MSCININDDGHTLEGYVITKHGIVIANTYYNKDEGWLTQARVVIGGTHYLREWCKDFTTKGLGRVAAKFASEMAQKHKRS